MAVHTHHESTSQETSALHTSASYKELQFLCVFIYLHIIAFSLELKLESRKLWHLGFVSLIPYLPEEPGVIHLSMWGLVSLKNIIFSCLLCSLKSYLCLEFVPLTGRAQRMLYGWDSFLAELEGSPGRSVLLCAPSSLGKGRRGRHLLIFIL